jgi:hypothetical protein
MEFEHGDNSVTAILRSPDGHLALNFPKARDVIQLGFTKQDMYKDIEQTAKIPISNYVPGEFADNTANIEEAVHYLETSNEKLAAFMINFYKSIFTD